MYAHFFAYILLNLYMLVVLVGVHMIRMRMLGAH